MKLELSLRLVLSLPAAVRPMLTKVVKCQRPARVPSLPPPEPIVTTGETVDRRVADRRCA